MRNTKRARLERMGGLVERMGNERRALEVLGCVAELGDELAALEDATVDSAREHGATWQQIGDALGVRRESAFGRHARRRR